MKSICKTLLFVTLILLFNSCNTTEYSSAQTLKIAVHSILDPAKNITVFFWQTKGINMEFDEDITNDLFIIELFENGDLIASDSIEFGFYAFNYKPQPSSDYTIKIASVQHPQVVYESLTYEILKEPSIQLVYFNDSIGTISENSLQLFQKIEFEIDTTNTFYPYFAYQVTSDSSALFGGDSDTILQTNKWSISFNESCPEVAVPAFFDGDYKIINRSCFQNLGRLPFGASTSYANEFDYMEFEICMIDQSTINLLRQVSQDDLFQSLQESFADQSFALFITKDNYAGNEGYDLIINRACTKFKVQF